MFSYREIVHLNLPIVMSTFIRRLLDAAHTFTAVDFAIFKVCLLAIGVLLGAYFSQFFMEYIDFIWVIGILTWVFLMVRVTRFFRR